MNKYELDNVKFFANIHESEKILNFMSGNLLTQEMHLQGINIRFLGLLLRYCTHTLAQERVILEILARAIKADIRNVLRTVSETCRIASSNPYRRALVDRLNLIFGISKKSIKFWSHRLFFTIVSHFPNAATKLDGSVIDFQKTVNKKALFIRVVEICNIIVSDHCLSSIQVIHLYL